MTAGGPTLKWIVAGPIQLAALALLLAAALGLYSLSERRAHDRAVLLDREINSLRLRDLGREIAAEADDLTVGARGLSELEPFQRVLAERLASPEQRGELTPWIRQVDADEVLLANAAGVARVSVALVGKNLLDRPADPALVAFLDSARAEAARGGLPPTPRPSRGFIDDGIVVAQPIAARATPTGVLGWLVLKRALATRVVARAAPSLSSSVTSFPWRNPDAAAGVDLGKLTAVPAADGVRITTLQSQDSAAGYVLLRDNGGLPVWVFRLERPPSTAGPAGSTSALRVALALGGVGLLVLLSTPWPALWRARRLHAGTDARYKAIIDQTNDGIVIVDSESFAVLDANPAFLTRVGYSRAEILALSLPDLVVDGTSPPATTIRRLREVGPTCALNMHQRCKNGSQIDVEVRCNALEVDGRPALAYITHDVSLRRKAEQQLRDNQQRLARMAHHDQLTGLPNRHYLAAFLPEAIETAKRSGTMLGVLFLDLDRFKHINDTRGHETGDKLLQEVARRLRGCVRDTDVVIRMGGDEFVVLLHQLKLHDEIAQTVARVVATLNHPIVVDDRPLQTSASIGVSVFPRDGADMVELLKHSDLAMYQAKDRGRNNVQVFSPVMNRKLKHRVSVEAALREAIRLKQLDVHYQPFVNLTTRRVVGLEALIRWRHPVHGMIPADRFIPVAEETGLVVPIGQFVLQRTLQTMSAWRNSGIAIVPVSINVAPAQLQRGELHAMIAALLKTHDLEPALLQLEMTERAVFDHGVTQRGESRLESIAALRDLGVKIAIDDFGTGYSSLSYLKHWRVDMLKIDRSFVRDLVTDSSDFAIVSAIVAIARHLHIDVIAEGVEGFQQADVLRRLNCTFGQGFLFAKPMPAEECVLLLAEKRVGPGANDDEDMLATALAAAN
jgi:diguanylate cyclase (GGDEF)-like protein/PAS domain S-box-containing protein